MKLIKARIRGPDTLPASRWFDLSPRLNLFQFADPQYGRNFLRILQTINPSYEICAVKPFADFPTITQKNGYTRHINPSKRTVALSVFSATPDLVQELATAGDWLYETDRIEVGRRLDYSRWINFVELASSTRWSEISTDIKTLRDRANQLEPDLTVPLVDILQTVQPTDRIKDELQEQLAKWLQNLPSELQKNSGQLIESTLTAVKRADHFQAARDIVQTRLPLFVVLDSSRSPSTSLQSLVHLVSDKADLLNRKSNDDKQKFLDELNNELEKLPFSNMMLRINYSPAGLSLNCDGKPEEISTATSRDLFKQIEMKVVLASAFSRVVYKTEPILLFTGPEQSLPNTIRSKFADFVINVADTCQCLLSYSDGDIFPGDVSARRYSAADLDIT
jgi:hypothetical protein